MAKSVVVIGGGISGLTTAWRLVEAGEDVASVVVLERSHRAGGCAWTERMEGYQLETGPNGFLDNRPSTIELCQDLGVGDRLIQANPESARRFVFLGDRLRKLPGSPIEFLRSDLLSARGKLRVLWERFVPRRDSDADESIADFGRRRIGPEAMDNLLDAFVTGVLAGDPERLSLPACFPRMAELEREFGSLIRAQGQLSKRRRREREQAAREGRPTPIGSPAGTLTAPRGGMRVVIDALADRLGSRLLLGVVPRTLRAAGDGRWEILGDGTDHWRADAVVLSCPAPAQAELLQDLDGELAGEIAGIPYSPAVVAVVGFRREDLPADLAGFGYLAPERLGRPVLGVLWSSSIFPEQAPAGCFQFRAILGGWKRRDVLGWTDAQVFDAIADDLRQTLGVARPPCFRWLCRWERAIPQYVLGHRDRLARIDARSARHAGLFLGGNCYRGVAFNDCTADGARLASQARAYLQASAS